ncbi:MAG: type VI secretion system baseplate subunit TssG [Candidatus Kapabacteria bacterium]|nr:type VI secretion system baseplate subunit TssG [Candidatus Kapabacteria bacterium]
MIRSKKPKRIPATIEEMLIDTPYEFDFFQALRVIEALHPGTVSPGDTAFTHREPVHFTSRVSNAFPASEIQTFKKTDVTDAPDSMEVNFMGLAGVNGVLPPFVTELIINQEQTTDDSSLREFLDIFNHRFISVFSRVRRTYRPGYTSHVPERTPAAKLFMSILGIGMKSLQNRMSVRDMELVPFAGLLAGEPVDVPTVEHIFTEFCGARATVKEYVGDWFAIDPEQHSTLGKNNSVLGVNSVAGKDVWLQTAGIHITLHNMSLSRFQALRPGGSEHILFNDVLRFTINDSCFADITLCLHPDEVPAPILGNPLLQLGRLLWLKSDVNTDKKQQYTFTFRYKW